MKAARFREMSLEELHVEEMNLSEELFRLRFQGATGQLERPSKMKTVRKDIARIKTIISEKMREAHGTAHG
ncbi:MAG: 50S ribosomal protein L29 [Acidobacteria bacterium]|nr:50S ribosomal protein L29 [Acidobacteriota bacterium]